MQEVLFSPMPDCNQTHAPQPGSGHWHGAVTDPLDVFAARQAVQALAAAHDFPRRACHELAIVVSELATNILKYGVRGTIRLGIVDDDRGRGLEIVAADHGPPLADLAVALRDGWTDRGPVPIGPRASLGTGLGAVRRMTDVFEYHPGTANKHFRAIRYLPAKR